MSLLEDIQVGVLVDAIQWPMICAIKDVTTVREALELCYEYNITSVPVQKGRGQSEYCGIVSVLDMLSVLAFDNVFRNPNAVSEKDLGDVKVLDWKVSDILGATEESKTLWEFESSTPLKRILEIFTGGVHRIIVHGESGSGRAWKRFISQTDLCRWLAKQVIANQLSKEKSDDPLLKRGSVLVSDVMLADPRRNKVVTLSRKATALTGLRLMRIHDVSSLAITDDKGCILGSLSASDVRGIKGQGELKLLLLPVMEFLKKISPVGVAVPDHILVYEDMDMATVLKNIVSAQVHRAWVIDDRTVPHAVISLTDINHHYCLFDTEGLPALKECMTPQPVDTRKLMKNVTIGSLIDQSREIVTVPFTATVLDCLQVMDKHNITSLPILEKAGTAIVGVLNMYDLLTYVAFQKAFIHYDDRASAVSASDLEELGKSLDSYIKDKTNLDVHARELLGFSKESKRLWDFREDISLLHVLECMSKGVHRILVHTEYRKSFMLSQIDIARWLNEKIDTLGVLPHRTLNEMGMGRKEKFSHVVTLSHKDSALTGFRKMSSHDVLAVPVVDDDGVIISTLSSSDVRGLQLSDLKKTLIPVLDFLELQGKSYLKKDQVTCKPSSTLKEVIKMVAERKIHRVWVVDDDGKPVNVVSLSDILYCFSPFNAISGSLTGLVEP